MTHDAFSYVLWGVVVVGVLVALITFAVSRDTYDQIGRGGLFEDESRGVRPARGASPASSGADRAEQEAEVRQMVEARNARRARRGEAPLDVEQEVAAYLRPATPDAGLVAEIRDLVEARNARRIRQGREPLDVEAEIARHLSALD